jgi:hypothetical protein
VVNRVTLPTGVTTAVPTARLRQTGEFIHLDGSLFGRHPFILRNLHETLIGVDSGTEDDLGVRITCSPWVDTDKVTGTKLLHCLCLGIKYSQ